MHSGDSAFHDRSEMNEPRTAITFPALAVSPGNSFLVVESIPATGSVTALRRGYFSRLYLFDSAGLRWPVVQVSALPSFLDRLLGRLVAVQLTFGAPELVPLGQIASDLCALVDADDDLYCQFVSHEELKAMLRQAASPGALIAIGRDLGEATGREAGQER